MSAAWLALLLLAAAPPDPAAVRRCRSSVDLRIFTSPAVPHARAPLRIIVAAEQDEPAHTPRSHVIGESAAGAR